MESQDKSMFDTWFSNGVFDHEEDNFNEILSILDFPMESLEGGDGLAEGWAGKLGPIPTDFLGELSPVSQIVGVDNGPNRGSCRFLDASLLDRKISQLKQQPTFVEENPKLRTPLGSFDHGLFQATSPNSVLESGSSSSSGKGMSIGLEIRPQTNKLCAIALGIGKRPRTKHSRRPTSKSWLVRSLISFYQIFQPRKLEEANRKEHLSQLQVGREMMKDSVERPNLSTKKCTHCEITKTPQWREGPTGPKTLCNACGVRYRSGRLFPEYRPAASPTFVPSLHSSSHKKVIEMRKNAMVGKDEKVLPKMECPMYPLPESTPMSCSLFDC